MGEFVFYTPSEVSVILGITRQTAYRIIYNKELPAGKVGGVWRVSRKALVEYLRARGLVGMDEEPDFNEVLKAAPEVVR